MDYSSLCNALNGFHLPRAIAHLIQDRFVAWNEVFLAACRLSAEELRVASLRQSTTFDEDSAIAPALEQTASTLIPFRLRFPDTDRMLRGDAAKKEDGFVLFLVAPPRNSEALESAWKQGRDDEHERILKLFHDDVGPKLLAAVFTAQKIKEELEANGLDENTSVGKIGDQLVEAIEGVAEALAPQESDQQPDQ